MPTEERGYTYDPEKNDGGLNATAKSRRRTLLFPSFVDIIFLCIFLSISFSVPKNTNLLADGDTGYHIRAGEYILQNLSIPRHDIFSFLTPPIPWTAHEWLSEVVMALIYRFGGLTGVVLFFAFLIAAEFALLFKMVQSRKGNLHANLLIVLLVIGASQVHWLARPHIFSLLLMTLWYFVLDLYQYDDKNYLYLLPPVMVVWVNLHGGFLIGLVLIGIYLVGNALQALRADGPGKQEPRRRMKGLMLLFGLCLVASMANPHGIYILLFPFKIAMNSFLMDHVDEFLSPDFHKQVLFKYLLLSTVVIFALSRKRVNAIEFMLLLFFANMSLASARYIPLFGVIIAPILSKQTDEIFSQGGGRIMDFLRRRAEKLAAFDASLSWGLWPLAAGLLVIVVAASGRIHFEFDRKSKPVDAVEFMKREHIPGNMFNNDEFGDYIIYAAWPQYRVFFDGRSDMYGNERMKDYFKVTDHGRDWEKVIEKYNISWIIYNTDSHLALYLEERKDWKLIYYDRVAEIFVRNTPEYASLIVKYPNVRPTAARPEKEKQKQP